MPKWSHYLEEEFEDEFRGFQKIKKGQRNRQEKEDKRESTSKRGDVTIKNVEK